jgi:predicted O-methyltransferase YrrM
MIATDRAEGKTGKVFDSLGAFSTLGNLRLIRALMLDKKPRKTIEIGMAFGGSCLIFANAHQELEHEPSQQHIAVDPFQTTFWDSVALEKLQEAGLSNFVQHLEQRSAFSLPVLLAQEPESIEMAYIDGSHLFEDVFIDFYYLTLLSAPGGLLLFDDSTTPEVKKVLRFINVNLGHLLEPIDLNPWRHQANESLVKTIGRKVTGRYQMTAYRKTRSLESGELRSWDSSFSNF